MVMIRSMTYGNITERMPRPPGAPMFSQDAAGLAMVEDDLDREELIAAVDERWR